MSAPAPASIYPPPRWPDERRIHNRDIEKLTTPELHADLERVDRARAAFTDRELSRSMNVDTPEGTGRTKRNPVVEPDCGRGWNLLLSDWLKHRRWAIEGELRRRGEATS